MVTVRVGGVLRHVLVDASAVPTVGAVHRVLGLPAPDRVASSAPLRHGYGVPPRGALPSPRSVRVVVAAGPDAGASAELRPGTWLTVGRAETCALVVEDPALSRAHLRVRLDRQGVEVEDLGSTNGLAWEPGTAPTDGTGSRTGWPPGASLRAGSSRLELLVDPLPPLDGRDAGGRLEVRPWPRPPVPDGRTELSTPAAPVPPTVRGPSAWSWALPLVASVVAAAVLRMPMVLVFGLMAPVMVLGHHLGERRSVRREHVRATARHVADREELGRTRERALRQDLQTRRRRAPGLLGTAQAWHGGPTTALWSGGDEPPAVVLGEGALPSEVLLDGKPLEHRSAPVVLPLDGPVALVGPPGLTAAAARSWVLQLATLHPPSRLAVVVDPDDPPGDEWDLLAWLPHTRPRPAAPPAVSLVWGVGILVRAESGEVPDGVPQVVIADAGSAVLRRPGLPDLSFRPTLLALPLARHLARSLAPLVEQRTQTDAPGPVALGDLVGWPEDTAAVRSGWEGATADLRVPVGTDPTGSPAMIDLASDGPHALVAGTTGSGKSELLRTLVTALALRNPPSRLSLLLVDYKGGSSLAECAALPHASGLVTDLDPHLARRVLTSLTAELRRREAVLAAAGARDVRDHKGEDLPRLVVVIDEFRVLAEELPDFLGGLVHLAAVGRSLGVHLVLATQRPAGVVSADLRANVNLRIALRVRDRSDSLDVLEVPDAADLPEGRPGLALVRTGAEPPRRVQVAPAAPGGQGAPAEPGGLDPQEGLRGGGTAQRPEVVAGAWEGWSRLHAPDPGPAAEGSGLGALPALLARVADQDEEHPLVVWRPPLPAHVTSSTALGAWALADRPEAQTQEPLGWGAEHHVAVVGAARTGRTTAVRALLASAGPCWLYAVDLGRGLEDTEVAGGPGLRAWVGPHDPAHGLQVLEAVSTVLDDRAGRPGRVPSRVVLVIDGWDRFLDAYRDVGGGRARDIVLRILRDGPASGVVVLLTGDRSLLSGAVVAQVPEVWALHLHDAADLLLAGLRRDQLPSERPPGRVVRTRDGLVAQVLAPDGSAGRPGPPAGMPPPRLESLPTSVTGLDAWAVGGDEPSPVPTPTGSVLVLGPPGSGVTTALAALEAARTAAVVHVGRDDVGGPPGASRLEDELRDHDGTVVVDDAHLLAGTRAEEAVLGWSARTGGDLLVGGELESCTNLFRGLVTEVARRRTGVVLQPAQPGQGALLGVRLPVDDRRVPGRGVLVERGRCTRVQVVSPGPASP